MRWHLAILSVLLCAAASAQDADPRALLALKSAPLVYGLSGEWRWMREGDDHSGGGLPATNYNGATFQDGYLACQSSTDDYAMSDRLIHNTNYFSAGVFFRTTNALPLAVTKTIFGQYRNASSQRSWLIGLSASAFSGSDGTEALIRTSSTGSSGAYKVYYATNRPIIDGKWHMVALTFAPNVLKMYVDGDDVVPAKPYDSATAAIIQASVTPLTWGIDGALYGNFNGDIGYSFTANRTLTPAEIQQIWIGGPHQ